MAHTSSHHLLPCFPIFILLLLLLLLQATTAAPPTTDMGFTMELIHRYSEFSPFYNGKNLTHSQLLQRLIHQSRSRVQWLESTINLGANTTTLRPPLSESEHLYVVSLSVGTGDGMKHYRFSLDTGSSLTWTPCKPCEHCFEQLGQQFEPDKSPTYHPLPPDDRHCAPPYKRDQHDSCVFEVRYMEGFSAKGVLSLEDFTFESDREGPPEVFSRLVFGCARSATVDNSDGRMDGVMGMGSMPVSIPMQLRHHISGRFTYCLVEPKSGNAGFLRFGHGVEPGWDVQSTSITTYPGFDQYYLALQSVSVNNRRLNFPPGTFARTGGRAGCFIDSGTTFTFLIKPAYDQVRSMLVEHFKVRRLRRFNGKDQGYDLELCYRTPRNYLQSSTVLPSMTLHFSGGADYHIRNEAVFVFGPGRDFFCWGMESSDKFTVLGAHQQYNVRIVYDLNNEMLSFAPEDCARDAHYITD